MIAFFRSEWTLLVMAAAIIALWNTPVLLPLKILIVFFHELSHLLAVLLTGGEPQALTLTPHQGGAVHALGGNRFVVLSAGYLGSLLIGLGLFLAALNSRADRLVTMALSATLLLVAAFYVRDGFALVFCTSAGAVLLITSRLLGHETNDFLLRLIGLTSMIYVPLDIFSDTLMRASQLSDARLMAEEIGGPTVFWGGLWFLLSLAIIWTALHRTFARAR